jgi:flagellar FliL protein
MADEEETKPQEAATEAPPKKGFVKWIIVGAILLVFIGIEVGLATFFVGKLQTPPPVDSVAEAKLKAQEEEEAKMKELTEMGAVLPAPIDITVNIMGTESGFVKCGVQLEYNPAYASLGAELEARQARIKNIIIDIMSSVPLSELLTNEGKQKLRGQIVTEVNKTLPTKGADGQELGKVRRAYFDSFVIQQ